MNATIITFPNAPAPKVERRVILTLVGRARRVEVIEDRTNGVLLYDVLTTNMWTDATTIVTGIFGQHEATKLARAQVNA